MTRIISGDRIGKDATLMVGVSAALLDEHKKKILLTRRADNGLWCLPGGHMEPGESAEEGVIRETWEETGLQVRVKRLIGIYTSPHKVIEYPGRGRFQVVAMSFEVEQLGGELTISNETTEFGWFSPDEISRIPLIQHHHERIADVFAFQVAAFYR
jgi:8-oxo-dGTP pyrophosphatase MutT (NUDIX family)